MQQMVRTTKPSTSYISRASGGRTRSLDLPQAGAGANRRDAPEIPQDAPCQAPWRVDPSSVAVGRAGPRPRQGSESDLADRLRRVQQRQQARFAALPSSMKEDFHILMWHQHRLRANQAAHDAALARLKRSAAPQS
jgi:hypothetical protein